MTYLCLSVAAAGTVLGFAAGVHLGIARGRLLEANEALAARNARMRRMVADIFNEEPRNRTGHFKECICWRCEIEHVTDSLVGSATYRGDE